MYALLWLLPLTLALAAGALGMFLWCVRSGQFEDLDGAAWRILHDDDEAGGGAARRPRRPSGREAQDREA
jgi:cbb3-type cytochrome oxidase maturation protein